MEWVLFIVFATGLSVVEANYLLGYAKGFEAQKDLQSLMAS